jgi:hypothetical protein
MKLASKRLVQLSSNNKLLKKEKPVKGGNSPDLIMIEAYSIKKLKI